MAGQQGQRREAAQRALSALVEKANNISLQVAKASNQANKVGEEMSGIVERSGNIKQMTDTQAGRSQRLREVTTESAERAKQTAAGAAQVVGEPQLGIVGQHAIQPLRLRLRWDYKLVASTLVVGLRHRLARPTSGRWPD